MNARVDAAVPADAENAPTGTWKTAQNAVSHSAHTHDRAGREEEKRRPKLRTSTRTHTRNSGHSPSVWRQRQRIADATNAPRLSALFRWAFESRGTAQSDLMTATR